MLSHIAAAFRLRQAVLSKADGVPNGTAKHGLNDHRDIGHERHAALVRRFVDLLFDADYLVVRGLPADEVAKHNSLVAGALDAVLTRCDQVSIVGNALPEHFGRIEKLLGVEVGMSVDLPIRLAAYCALYGYLHPRIEALAAWAKGPGIQPWWRAVEGRSRTPIKASALHSRGNLDPHTARDLRDGKSLPNEDTIRLLAERLSTYGVRPLGDDRDATPSELEFELRSATAAVQHGKLVERFVRGAPDDAIVLYSQAIFSVLKDGPDPVSEDLLRHGMLSNHWPELRPRVIGFLVIRVADMAQTFSAGMTDELRRLLTNPREAWRRMAADFAEQASFWRKFDPRPGADGPDKRWAEYYEGERDTWLALAEGRPQDMPRQELLTELRSDALCLEALAPWLKLTPEQEEERLREAVRIWDSSSYAHRRLALHLRGCGRVDEAVEHLHRALQLNSDNEESRESLTIIYVEGEAWHDVLTTTDVACPTTTLRAARARALVALGDYLQARKLAEGVLSEAPKHPMALRVLALCHREGREERKARELEARADFYERGAQSTGEPLGRSRPGA